MKRARTMAGRIGGCAVAALILGLPATPTLRAQTAVAEQAADAERLEELEYRLEAERTARQTAEKALAERTKTANEQRIRLEQIEGTTSTLTKNIRELQAKAAEQDRALVAAQSAADTSAKAAAEQGTKIEELEYQLEAERTARQTAEKSLAERTKTANEQRIRLEQIEGTTSTLTKNIRELQAKAAEQDKALVAAQNAAETAGKTAVELDMKLKAETAARAAAEQSLAQATKLAEEQKAQATKLAEEQKARIAQIETASASLAKGMDELQAKLAAVPAAAVEFGALRLATLEKVGAGLAGRSDAALAGETVQLKVDNLFETGQATLAPPVAARLGELAKILRDATAGLPEDGSWVLRVEGHTDAQRPGQKALFKTNIELSAARAAAVTAALTAGGFPSRRLAAVGYGASRPIDNGTDAEAFRRNRRVELTLAER